MGISSKQVFLDVSEALKASSKRLSHFYYSNFDFSTGPSSNMVLITSKGNKNKVLTMVKDYRNLITQFYDAKLKYSSSFFSDDALIQSVSNDIEYMIEEDKKVLFFIEGYTILEK